MKSIFSQSGRVLAFCMASALTCGAALADRPDGAGRGNDKGRSDKHEQRDERRDDRREGREDNFRSNGPRPEVRMQGYFVEQQRAQARDYYAREYAGKRCPPGLVKRQNGCTPPGQARRWVSGRPLPSSVIYYTVPQAVVVQLGVPPSGYRYVRVASDILLIAVGTGIVVDAIEDLMRP
jgi:Ni/Co efflux regulator RcnB